MFLKKLSVLSILVFLYCTVSYAQQTKNEFPVRGFHLDLRIQVMKMPSIKKLVLKLKQGGINTLIIEYEATYPYASHPLIANRYAYTKAEIKDLVAYCNQLGIDLIPLQQSFGHVEYILRHNRYSQQREDQQDLSQVCPSQEELNKKLFTDLFTELAASHTSKYIHIGGDETHLLGHCPICRARVEKDGIAKLYGEHIKLMCDIVIKLGKIPVLWADIALKYPDALQYLPKQVIFVDWNYGWGMDKFGDHEKLMKSGFEIWGAASLRSSPDNYNLTLWQKHFENIRDFLPAARKLGYKGMILTSWSTSGVYDRVNESGEDLMDLYPIRRVYPLTAFNLLIDAFTQSLKTEQPLNIEVFVIHYCNVNYGFNQAQAIIFWNALKAAPYEVINGKVKGPISLTQLVDSAAASAKTIHSLKPLKNKDEYAQYSLMADTRLQYLTYQHLEATVNAADFKEAGLLLIKHQLAVLLDEIKATNLRYTALNQDTFYPSELALDNQLRLVKVQLLYDRLSKNR
ncbi:beta-N-acetylhexosaminidase [Pedobacter sp. L105]|uniref:beta-N-acetylhexosaminidase n=1 Tax=Pedobacter sp. L105 TaxID=1641871 RepID=UPI0020B1122A|nr:beta-N-acetylhexosaminidase [Pedobacter sp. L105]